MTHDELRDKIYWHWKTAEDSEFHGLGGYRKALRAVVELHKPCEPVSDDKFVTCETCNYEYHREYPWPCETIQAIEKELNG